MMRVTQFVADGRKGTGTVTFGSGSKWQGSLEAIMPGLVNKGGTFLLTHIGEHLVGRLAKHRILTPHVEDNALTFFMSSFAEGDIVVMSLFEDDSIVCREEMKLGKSGEGTYKMPEVLMDGAQYKWRVEVKGKHWRDSGSFTM